MPQVVQTDNWQCILSQRFPAPRLVACELAGDVLGVAVPALDVAEDERIRAGKPVA